MFKIRPSGDSGRILGSLMMSKNRDNIKCKIPILKVEHYTELKQPKQIVGTLLIFKAYFLDSFIFYL